jgi:hypothetical protein
MGEIGGVTMLFLTSALGGWEWLASSRGCYNPGEEVYFTHRIGGWVGPRAGLKSVMIFIGDTIQSD